MPRPGAAGANVDPELDELVKLLTTRRDARAAVIGPPDAVAKYLGETEENLDRLSGAAGHGAAVLFLNAGDEFVGSVGGVVEHDGPVVLGAASLDAIPRELRRGLVVIKAPTERWWRRRRPGVSEFG